MRLLQKLALIGTAVRSPSHLATWVLSLAAATASAQSFPFEDVSSQAGIHRLSPTYDAAAADIDLDGDIDVFVANHGQPSSFYINNGDSTFTDRAPEWGLAEIPRAWEGDWHGVAFIDVNQDGYPDLIVSSGALRGAGLGPNHIAINQRGRSFSRLRRLEEPLADAPGRHRSVVCRDFDRNGVTDVLFLSYASRCSLIFGLGGMKFEDRTEQWGIAALAGTMGCVTHLDDDRYLDLVVQGNPCSMLLGRPGGGFNPPLPNTPLSRISCVSSIDSGDLDGDGDDDLYVTRGVSNMSVVTVQGSKVLFELIGKPGETKGFRIPIADVSGIAAEVYVEGWPNPPRRFVGREGTHPEEAVPSWTHDQLLALGQPPPVDDPTFFGVRMFVDDAQHFTLELVGGQRRDLEAAGRITVESSSPVTTTKFGPWVSQLPRLENRILLNDGSGNLRDGTEARGAADAASSRMSAIGDFDNDGDLDIYVLNNAPYLVDEPDCLYLNDGRGVFTPVPSPLPGCSPGQGRPSSVLALDYDNDGDLDLFITNGDGEAPFNWGPHQLLRNKGRNGHWLEVRLIGGRHSDRFGLGARLTLELPDGRALVRECNGGASSFSQSLLPVHFGLGDNTFARTLRIVWPSGREQEISRVKADQVLTVVEERSAQAASEPSLGHYLATWTLLGVVAVLGAGWARARGRSRDAAVRSP